MPLLLCSLSYVNDPTLTLYTEKLKEQSYNNIYELNGFWCILIFLSKNFWQYANIGIITFVSEDSCDVFVKHFEINQLLFIWQRFWHVSIERMLEQIIDVV